MTRNFLSSLCQLTLVLGFIILPKGLANTSTTVVSSEIFSLCDTCQVLILGETHRQPESHTLFLDLVKSLLAKGERILIGLEITTGKQDDLDAVMEGRESPEGIAPPMIDSPSYQAMLLALGQFQQDYRDRIKVVAIDDLETATPRDEAMATHLQSHLATGKYDRAVVLVGNIHAIRKMKWADDAYRKEPHLAERLVNAGFRVTSVMQDLDTKCDHLRQPTLYSTSEQKGLDAIQRRLQIVKSHPEMDVSKAVDGIVVWECRR